MSKEFATLYDLIERFTLHHISPQEAQLKLSAMDTIRRKKISEQMRALANQIDSSTYSPDQGLTVLATYASAIADEFGADTNIAMLAMFTVCESAVQPKQQI